MLSFSLVAEALTGLIYHRPSGENSKFAFRKNFNSKHKQFGCVKPNKSGQTLVNMAKDPKLLYVNQPEPNRHTREDLVHGTSDTPDTAFTTQV